MEKLYTIGDAAKKLHMPASTIRYYDKKGLLPHMNRTKSGIRTFSEEDLEWLRFIERLKASGMPLSEIKEFIDLHLQGDATIPERKAIVDARLAKIEQQIEELKLARDYIYYKAWFYEVASENGSTDIPHNMPFDDLPKDIQRIKKKCEINRY